MAIKKKKIAELKTIKKNNKLFKVSRKKISSKEKLWQKSLRPRSVLVNLEKVISLIIKKGDEKNEYRVNKR